MLALLHSRSLLRLSGADALSFLQGLVTTNTTRLPEARAQYAVLLTPQGKFLHAFFLLWQDGDVLVDVDAARAEDLRKRLMMYRLRSKVEIAPEDVLKVAACWQAAPPALTEGFCVADPRLGALGHRLYGTAFSPDAAEEDYDAMRLSLAVPDAHDLVPEKSFPLQYGLDALNAVDFAKGCYVGQEVTARSKHLGTQRKAVFAVRTSEGALPPPGTKLMLDGAEAGEMRSSQDGIGLALLQVEAAGKGGPFTYEGGSLSASVPSWSKKALEA